VINRPPKRFFEFDSFRIDVEERQLLHKNRPVVLTPKVFDILLELVENNGHTVGKDVLMERIWTGTFVEEGNLNRNVSTLRKILHDDSRKPRFIKTVPKRGYRFDGKVEEILEEDEDLTVEKRTNHRIAVRNETETRPQTTGRFPRFFLIAVASVVAIAIIGIVWTTTRTADATEANVTLPAGTQSGRTSKNGRALELYKTGREHWRNRSAEGLHQAIIDLEQAIQLDPGFAIAHAALADAYAFDIGSWKKAEDTANEAIRLDPGLGEPHATIGFIRTFWEWKFSEAEPYFKRAITLSPDYATAHQWYSLNLAARSNGGASLAEMKRALELEPASQPINADLCQVLYFSRKYDQAINQCLKTLEMDPGFLNAHFYLYDAYTAKEMYDEAVNEFFKTEELNMTSLSYPTQLEKLRTAYATGGIRSFWRTRIEMLKKPMPNSDYSIGRYYVRLGEQEQALRWFRSAYEKHDFGFMFFAADPTYVDMMSDQRFQDLGAMLMSKVGSQ